MMYKRLIKKYVPNFILNMYWMLNILVAYLYDYSRYIKYSSSLALNSRDNRMMGSIIRSYHIVEKGLTMPVTRLGFGTENILYLCKCCDLYIKKFGYDDIQIKHALGVLKEYRIFHDNANFNLDQNVLNALKKIDIYGINPTKQIKQSKDDYFKDVNESFFLFSNSRSSIRNYDDTDIPIESLKKVLDLVKNTPSACNRQCWRTYVYSNKDTINKILSAQGGNRGFGHMTNKLIIVTADISLFSRGYERTQCFVDGGMYAMNLLYSLHYHQIAACILNCSNSVKKDVELRRLTSIKPSENFVAMISCGIPPQVFQKNISKRYPFEMTNSMIE